jgi:general secretion pathway protein F
VTQFAFQALDRGGTVESGRIRGEDVQEVLRSLRERGLLPFEVAVTEAPPARAPWHPRRIKRRDVTLGLQALATLLEAGFPLDQALGSLPALAPAAWRPVIRGVRSSVRRGESLTEALSDDRLGLPPAVLGIVRAAEAGGGLGAGLARAADLMKADVELRSAIRSALAYPLLLGVAAAGALGLLVGVVLPRFALILNDLGQELPGTTRVVLDGAQALRWLGPPAALAGVAGAFLLRAWTASETGRRWWHHALMRVPWLGAIRLSAGTARACAALGALLRAGCPLPSALRHAANASGDAEIQRRVQVARERVTRGERLAASLESSAALTPTAVRLLAAGEHGGRLAEMTERAGRLEEASTRRAIEGAVRMIEPVMIIVFGGAVALVAAALLQAVYAVRPGA